MPRRLGQTKRTPEVDKRIAQAIKLGASYRDAARAAGISEDTLARWRARDAEFAEMLTRAEAEGKVGWLAKIEQAANAGDWRAIAWKLERRYPHEWGKVERQEHSGVGGQPVEFTVNILKGKLHDDSDRA